MPRPSLKIVFELTPHPNARNMSSQHILKNCHPTVLMEIIICYFRRSGIQPLSEWIRQWHYRTVWLWRNPAIPACIINTFYTKDQLYNREYLVAQVHNTNSLIRKPNYTWSYDYPLANHIASYENYAVSPFSHLFASFAYLRKSFLWRV